MMDDATGKVLYARFVAEEGTKSTLEAILQVVRKHGRFCELYTDRGSHFCRTEREGEGPSERQDGQVSRALSVLGIKQILARSPEARGRGERMFPAQGLLGDGATMGFIVAENPRPWS
jgi:hypothetical protein